jgi:hypothetical protein
VDICLDGKVAIVTGTGPNNAAWLHAAHLLEDSLTDFDRAVTIAVNGNFLDTVIDDTLLASGTTPLQPPGKANREQHG